jgi:2-dehydropantoate 2-reductase
LSALERTRIVRAMPGGVAVEPVLIAGAGALGSVVGGLLAARGVPVTLLGRADHLESVRRAGLHIEGLFGDHRVREIGCVTETAALRGRFGAVFLSVKSWDTAAMAGAVAPHLAPDGHLVSLQNGLGNLERIAAAVGDARVLGARVIFGAEVVEPGRVRVTVEAAPVLVGSLDPADAQRVAAAARWAAALRAAGIPAEPTASLLAELWAKVFYNAALNPLGALLGVPYGRLPEDPDARAIMDDAIAEAFAVARAEGVELAWPDAESYRTLFYGTLVPSTARHRSSMLQDLEHGRPTEIDAINGYVAARGAALGIPTPVNATLTRMIRARVRHPRPSEEPWTH